MARAFNRNPARRPRPAARKPDRTSPLPGAIVDAVLRFHDQAQDQGGGRLLLRMSPRRLRDAEVEAALGRLVSRASAVSILWNEREAEIIRVLEDRMAA